MSVAITVEFSPESGPRRRVRFEPRTDEAGHWRITEAWSGCRWRVEGRERVDELVCEIRSGDVGRGDPGDAAVWP